MTCLCTCSGRLTSTLELSRKRNQLTKASCETCGGRPSIDGIEPVSASMLGTVDLELTNFINPDLTWKKATKGNRSTTRRPRMPATKRLNSSVEQSDKSPQRVPDSSVFESEKLGVAVLGQRFAEEVQHVPLKKRRHLLRSPSPSPPPPTPSPDHEDPLSTQTQTHSSHHEEPEQLVDSKCASGQWCRPDTYSNRQILASDQSIMVKFVNGVGNANISKVATNGEHGYSKDFSGIALLAAAACSSNIDETKEGSVVEEYATSEGIASSTDAIPLEEMISLSATGKFSQNNLVTEDNTGAFSDQDNFGAVMHNNLHAEENGGAVKKPVPLKDDRSHWDLNTVMDAWDEPCDDPLADSPKNGLERVVDDGLRSEGPTSEGCGMERNSEGTRCDIENKAQSVACNKVSSEVHRSQLHLDSSVMVLGTSRFSIEEDKMENFSTPERTCIEPKCVSTPAECVQETLNYTVADIKAITPVISMDTSPDSSFCPGSHHIANASPCVLNKKINTTTGSIAFMQNGEDCCRTSAVQLGKSSLPSVQTRKRDVASPDISFPESAVYEIDSIKSKDGEDFGNSSGLPDNRTSPGRMINRVTCNTLDVNKVDHFNPSPKCGDISASSISIGQGQPPVISDVMEEDIKVSTADTTVNDFSVHIEPKELLPKCYEHLLSSEGVQGGLIYQEFCKSYGDDPTSCAAKPASKDHFSDCHGSDVPQDDRGRLFGVENMIDIQVGYESPFEDGELRESWEEDNEAEDRETECVDYGSDNGDGDDFDAVDYSLSENFEVGLEGHQIVEKDGSLAKKDVNENIGSVGKRMIDAGSGKGNEQCIKGGPLMEKYLSASLKTSGGDQLQEHSQGNDNGLDDRGLLAGELGSRASTGKLLNVEGPSSFNLMHRKDSVLMQRSRADNVGVSYSRAERGFDSDKSIGRERFSFQVRGRNEVDGHWVDSSVGSWDARNRYPHSYRGRPDRGRPEGHGYSRPRNAIANSASNVGEFNLPDNRRSINYSSKGTYRPLIRRRSPPADRDDSYGSYRRGTPPMRGIGRDRNRGRSGVYPQGVRRGPKEEYNEQPVPDDVAVPSVRMPHYLGRRERGFSPNFSRGGAHFSRPPRRKSRSRSRTRSPLAWHLQRGDRDVGPTRRHSPDFRSEARMEGMRLLPFQKRSFAASDYEETFHMSSPRGRLPSPQRNNTRWSDDDHFRDRRSSPVRMFRRSQRFDSVGYSGRFKSDDYFRPMVRRGRSPIAGSGRGRKFEDSDDDRRKRGGDGYEMIQQVRHYDAGVVRRSRYDNAEDCLEARNSHNEDNCFRGTVRRDVPRIAREEKGPARYNSDRMCTTASPSGPQDYKEDASPRGG